MDAATGKARHSKATKSDGSPCRSYAMAGSDYCFFHNPKTARTRTEASTKGGQQRHRPHLAVDTASVKMNNVSDVVPLLERAVNDTLRLENSIARASALGHLTGQIVRAFEAAEFEQRLTALEQLIHEER